MSTEALQSLPLNEFPVAISSRDLQGDFVVPKSDGAERLRLARDRTEDADQEQKHGRGPYQAVNAIAAKKE